MDGNRALRPSTQLMVGLLVIVAGVVLTLDNLGVVDAWRISRFWPLALMAVGLVNFLDTESRRSHLFGAALLVLGSLLLVNNLSLRVPLHSLWPLVWVAIGAVLLWRGLNLRSGPASENDDRVSAFVVLGGIERTCTSPDFRGGQITAFMGGCEIDLRRASIVGEATLDVLALWGGIEIRVPDEWAVVSLGIPLLGGFTDRTRGTPGSGQRLVIRGFAIMGGVEVKN